jgi:hypothetical protein
MPAVQPGAYNVVVKSHEASNKLVIDYARNINDFALNQYVQIVPAKAITGYYLEFTVEEAARILHSDLRNFVWYDGDPAPMGQGDTEAFEFKEFRCTRRAFPVPLGDMTIENASWDILAQHLSIKARQAMTARTQLAITAATTSGNYSASHYIDATAISGASGNWAASTTSRQDIKRSIETGVEIILDDTLNAVNMEDICLVISSGLAKDMSLSQEISDYLKGSPQAYAQVRGELPSRNGKAYGLPDTLYGVKLVVEATRKVTSKKGATRAASSVLAKGTPFLCSRPGALEGVAGSPSFSTLSIFAQEEMTAETFNEPIHRRKIARVVDTVEAKVTGSASGVLFYNAA